MIGIASATGSGTGYTGIHTYQVDRRVEIEVRSAYVATLKRKERVEERVERNQCQTVRTHRPVLPISSQPLSHSMAPPLSPLLPRFGCAPPSPLSQTRGAILARSLLVLVANCPRINQNSDSAVRLRRDPLSEARC
jgi:hypothetical protein